MAYGALIDASYYNHVGGVCRVLFERDGYSGTTYDQAAKPKGWDLKHGSTGGSIDQQRANLLATTGIMVANSSLMAELQKVPGMAPRAHRLTLERGGQVIFKGWCKPDATSTPRHPTMNGVVTIQAKDNLKGLSSDWVDASGNRFTGDLTYSAAIAQILGRLGLSLPIEAVVHWRPSSMVQSDDPLSTQVPTDAFYRTGSDGDVRKMAAGAVLDDLLTNLNAQIIQQDGVWKIQQPGAFTEDQTDSNDEVTVWEYDSSGTFQTTSTRPAAVDITDEAWTLDSGEVGGEEQLVDSRVTYEHGAPAQVEFEGSFETTTNWTFSNGTYGGALGPSTDNVYIYKGEQGLKIEGQEYDPNNLNRRSKSDDYAEHSLGILTPASEAIDLVLRDRAWTDSGQANVDDSHQFWTLRLEVIGSNSVFYWDESNGVWTTSPSPDRRNEIDSANPIPMDGFRETSYQIPAPPNSGELFLKLWNPTYDEGATTINAFYSAFDELLFERTAEGPSKTVYRAHDPTVEEGETINRTVRIGQGPWKGSQGAILDDTGDVAFDWSLSSSSGEEVLSLLAAKRLLALRSSPQETTRLQVERPTSTPRADRAVDYDGVRHWPVYKKEQQPRVVYEVRAIELTDNVPSSVETEIIPGGGDDISDTPSGSSSTTTTTEETTTDIAWGDIANKPSDLLAASGDSDSYSGTQSVADSDLQGLSPTFSGLQMQNGVTTPIDEISDDTSLTDGSSTALVTENAIKSYIDSEAGAQALDDLTDVTLTHTSKYDPEDILAGNDSGKFTDKTINTVLNEAVLKDVGDVVTANRDDNDVLTWDGGNSQYDHTAPGNLLSEVLALNDLSDVRGITDYDDGDILAVDSTLGSSGEFTERTISDVLQYGEWADLGDVATGSAQNTQVGAWISGNTQWEPRFIADLIRERGALSVGDVSFAATWRTIESDAEPTTRDDDSALQDGDVWIDTDATPVAEAYVWRNSQWNKTASAIGGNNIVTDAIDADKITADTITANEIEADTITAGQIKAGTITAAEINAGTITANEISADTITANEIAANAITGNLIDATTSITVGDSAPNILIDGSVDPSRVESTNYASLVSGFRIQSDGFAEFNDVRVRGEIRSSVFRVNTQVGVGGTQVVAPSTTLAKDASSGSTDLWLQDEIFRVGDDIRLHEEGVTETVTIGSGPVLHNPLDGDADSLIGPDGTIQGDPQPAVGVNGVSGEALDFDGTGDYVGIADNASLGFDDFTASFWVKYSTSQDNARWLSKRASSTGYEVLTDNGSVVTVFIGDGTNSLQTAVGNTALNDGNGHHVAVVRQGGTVDVYVDGSLDGSSSSFPSGSTNNTSDLNIGAAFNATAFFDGIIDEPRLYDRALSAGEVQELYDNPTSPPLFASASSALSNTWTKGAAAVQWSAERIVDDAQSEFAPFRSYIDSNNEEFMRLGNIAGRTQLTGNGMVVGDRELVFSTDNDLLEVQGRVSATTGEFGPFSIGAHAVSSPHMMLSETEQAFQISTLAGTDLNVITNRDFSSTDSNDQPTGWSLPGVKSTGVYAYPYLDTGSNEKEGELQQTVDYSASAGETVTWQLEVSTQELGGGYKVIIEIQDKVSGDYLASRHIDDDTGGAQTTFSVKAELPSSDASQIEIHIRLRGDPTGDTNETRLYSIKSYSESAKAELKESGIELFGDAQQRTFYVDRVSGDVEVHGTLEAKDMRLQDPMGGTRWFEWFTAEPLNFQDSSGNTQTENAAYWDVNILSFDSLRNSNPEPPTPSSGMARLWIQNNQLRIKYPDGTTAIIGP